MKNQFQRISQDVPYSAALRRFSQSPRGQAGQAALIAVVFFLFIGLTVIGGMSSFAALELRSSRALEESKQSYVFAEGALEDGVYRSLSGKNLPDLVSYAEESFSASVTVTDTLTGKTIVAAGRNASALRNIEATLAETGTIFRYASHVGDLGLEMFSSSRINGNVFSNGDITGYSNTVINGDAFAARTISSPRPTVIGTRGVGVDPVALPDIDVVYWETRADINGDAIEGNVEYDSGDHSLGPRKINGSLKLNSNARLSVTGPMHVTGDIELNDNAEIFLHDAFGSDGTVVIAGGSITFNSNSIARPTSASPKGYIVFVSLASGEEAIELDSNAKIGAVIYAVNGRAILNSNSEVAEIFGRGVRLNSNTKLNYDLGLRNMALFGAPSSTPSISGWREVQ